MSALGEAEKHSGTVELQVQAPGSCLITCLCRLHSFVDGSVQCSSTFQALPSAVERSWKQAAGTGVVRETGVFQERYFSFLGLPGSALAMIFLDCLSQEVSIVVAV